MLMLNVAGLIAFVILVDTTAAQEGGCYDGWVKYGSSCYGFGEEYVSWPGASSLCQIFDGSLAEIETAEENEFLKNHSRTKGYSSLWIGGTDIFSEGYWVWSSSKLPIPVSGSGFSNWAPGEPNHLGGPSNEDCLQLYAKKGYAWNDANCDSNSPFVCEVVVEE